MKLAVITGEELEKEFASKQISGCANVCIVNEPQNVPADSYIVFDLLFKHTPERVSHLRQFLPRPVIINSVTDTLTAVDQPFIRINAWPTFLERNIVEVAALPGGEKTIEKVFNELGWNYLLVPDITGMISARIAGAIINEAYHTLQAKVSTRSEIDIAMKLGTHYPYGPFEWSKKIGLKKVYEMLLQLSKENSLYEVSTLLSDEANV